MHVNVRELRVIAGKVALLCTTFTFHRTVFVGIQNEGKNETDKKSAVNLSPEKEIATHECEC